VDPTREMGILPGARDGGQRADVGDEIGIVAAARDEPDDARGAALDVHGHHRLGAGVPHDDLRLTLRAEQRDVLASPEAAALEIPRQSPVDGAAHDVEADDDDGVDAGAHASDAERAVHLAKLPVGPLHDLGGRGDEVRAARDGVVAEEQAHGGAPERAAERADPGAWQDGLSVGDPASGCPRPGPGREGLESVDAFPDGERDDDVVVAVEPLALRLGALGVGVAGVGVEVEVEGDDDGGVAVGAVVAGGGREALAGEGGRVGDVVGGGAGAAEADEAAGGGERGDGLGKEGGEGGVRDQLLGGGRHRVEGGVGDVPGQRVVQESRERVGQPRGRLQRRVGVLGVRQRVQALGVVGVKGGGEEVGGSGGVIGLGVGAGAGRERDDSLVVVGGRGEDDPVVDGLLVGVHGEQRRALDRMLAVAGN
jgi:hypothetical protein